MYALVFLVLLVSLPGSSAWCDDKGSIDENFERGRSFFESGDLSGAAALLEEVVASQPDHEQARTMLFECHRFLGIEYYGQSRYDDAIGSWRKALTLEPENKEIQSYITRCESEMKALARFEGQTYSALDSAQSPQLRPAVHVDSEYVSQPDPVVSEATDGDEAANLTSNREFDFGLSSGIVMVTGNSHGLGRGMVFIGRLSYLSDEHWLGARLDGTHTRFYKDSFGAASEPRHLGISGLSMNAVFTARISHFATLDYSVGLGIYEIIQTEPDSEQYSSTTQKSTALGASFGVGWRRSLGAFALAVDAMYIDHYSHLSPSLLQISIGITSR